jgi:hypothetical protein
VTRDYFTQRLSELKNDLDRSNLPIGRGNGNIGDFYQNAGIPSMRTDPLMLGDGRRGSAMVPRRQSQARHGMWDLSMPDIDQLKADPKVYYELSDRQYYALPNRREEYEYTSHSGDGDHYYYTDYTNDNRDAFDIIFGSERELEQERRHENFIKNYSQRIEY